ncbi:AAA family ATPase [Actinotalea sp. BY-33]|uniref:AAA family ATPase n=1 Tax=Actinotalea soli TaxID=2819234 RepID=A0A939LS16_9CELL|nr:helix-turn-helix transcriptional regulator [Actinotalea soli]MBO1753028.1 AAA family ATPase [Actinotalea soli]
MARNQVSATFVGRHPQVEALTAAVHRAGAGVPGVVLVGADAGVGKTRLLARLTEVARAAGAVPVTTHCVDLGEVGLPYLPFAEALAQLRADPALREVVDQVVTERPALARLLPAHGTPPPDPADDGGTRLQLFDGIAAALGAVGSAGAPLVLVVEDLHWADSSSRDVLRFLVARLRTEHLLVVLSYRTDDLHRRHPLRPVLAELWRHPRVERLDLPPFTSTELHEFAAAVTGAPVPDAVVDRVMERSAGNAYFAEELLESGPGAGGLPWTLSDVLQARVERLDPSVQELARVASVAGRTVGEPLLRAVAGSRLPVEELDRALREAVEAQVLGGEDGRIAFRHALLAEAVYGALLPGEQVALHRAYRDALQQDPRLGSTAQLAHHAHRGQDLPTALAASIDAAREAGRLLAPDEELRHLETALRLWDGVPDAAARVGTDEADLTAAAASAASRAGHDARAVLLARQAVALATDLPARQAQLRSRLALYLLGAARDAEALEEAAHALETLERPPFPGPDLGRAWALAIHARAATSMDEDAAAERSARLAVDEARALGAPAVEADALATLAVLVVDDQPRAAALLTEAGDRAREAGDLVTEVRCAYSLAANYFYAGDLERAVDRVQAGLDLSHTSGLTWSAYAVQLHLLSELLRFTRGDLGPPVPWDGAPPSATVLLEAVALHAAVARGDGDAVDRGARLAPLADGDHQVTLIAGGCTVDALTWAGRHEEAVALARSVIEEVGRAWSDYFLGSIWLAALGLGALADARSERAAGPEEAEQAAWFLDRARTAAGRGRPRGGRLGPEGRAWLARVEAEHARWARQNDPALWAGATDAYGYGHRYEQARSRRRRAEALLEAGEREAGLAQLVEALAEAREMGAAPLVAALESLARRSRLEVPGARTTTDLLTPREAEVLALAAQGLSNRQIGEKLFISGKTVSVHVSNLLAKLGVSGRAEAVSVAHRRGLLGPD